MFKQDEIPPDAPEPLGNSVQIIIVLLMLVMMMIWQLKDLKQVSFCIVIWHQSNGTLNVRIVCVQVENAW